MNRSALLRDPLLVLGLAGLIGSLADGIVHWLAILVDITHFSTGHFIASIIFATVQLSPAQVIVGEIAHIVSGMVVSIFPFFLLQWSGFRTAILKGVGIGMAFWVNHSVIIPSFVEFRVHLTRTVADVLVDLIGLCCWGMLTTYLIAKYFISDKGNPP